jgi:tetratricopeptide (TPR) repeat protein
MRASGIHDVIDQQFSSPGLFQHDSQPDEAAYSETFYPFSSFGWSPLHALETERFHYIDAPQPELYDLVADPEEKNNLAAQQTATLAVLKDKLQALLRKRPYTPVADSNSGLSPDALDKLRSLGYVAYRSPVSADALAAGLADPKTKLWEFNSILEAEDALQRRDDDQADAILRKVQEQDSGMYAIPFLLGESAVRREKWGEAADQLERCLKLNPNFESAMTGLARALAKLGRTEEAKVWLRKALDINRQNYRAWYETGLLEAASDPGAALSAYQKAVAVQPNFYPGQRELGMALFNRKDYVAAADHLEKTLTLGYEDAPIHNFLAICYSQSNQPQKSIRNYEAALKLDPNLAEAHLNLGFELHRIGKLSQSRAEYAAACRLEAKLCAVIPK